MGQIFYACAYDTGARECCTIAADKFHANCFSYSGAVHSTHYLLRKKPYHIMWGGDDIVSDDVLGIYSRQEDLLGISTYRDKEEFEINNDDLTDKSYCDKVKYIDENSKLWKRIDVLEDAMEFFDWENTHSVSYNGYLVNHTKRQAVDLADYYEQSKYMSKDGIYIAIDPVPVLTETGGGSQMVFLEGVSCDSTEELAGEWCGDLLQIVKDRPEGYQLINCCFAELWHKAKYCYKTYGVDNDGFLLNDESGRLFKGARLQITGKRGASSFIKVEEEDGGTAYIPQPK